MQLVFFIGLATLYVGLSLALGALSPWKYEFGILYWFLVPTVGLTCGAMAIAQLVQRFAPIPWIAERGFGFPPRRVHLSWSAAVRGPARTKDHVEADVHFMQGMIGHHEQALAMAAMAPTHGAGERVQLLARKVDVSQRDEIASMTNWLKARGLPLHGEHHHAGMAMPGMLTPEQLARLDAARGAEFDRLFLTYMIQHHRGAVTMVDELFGQDGAAQDAATFKLASDVQADQRTEIDRMEKMLSALPAEGGAR